MQDQGDVDGARDVGPASAGGKRPAIPYRRIKFSAWDSVARAEATLALGGIADVDIKRTLTIIANNSRIDQRYDDAAREAAALNVLPELGTAVDSGINIDGLADGATVAATVARCS